MIKYFRHPAIFAALMLCLGGYYGFYSSGSRSGAFSTIFIIITLSVLEISLSFDNAIVNVQFLKNLNHLWQRRFLTWGILIAIFAMRLIFPIILVALFAHMSPWYTLQLALSDPQHYSELLHTSHIVIAGFGGAFLMMVGLNFFFDQHKKVFWFQWIEQPLEKLGKIRNIDTAVVLIVLVFFSLFVIPSQAYSFFVAGIRGILLYIFINGLGSILGGQQHSSAHKLVTQAGLMGFLYLEILDASFSLDGVIGAFALSSNIFVIATGLGVGAFFIRSFTFYMLREKTLKTYRYLEYGAFYSVVSLALTMMIGSIVELPSLLVGCIGIAFVGFSFYCSLLEKKYHQARYKKLTITLKTLRRSH